MKFFQEWVENFIKFYGIDIFINLESLASSNKIYIHTGNKVKIHINVSFVHIIIIYEEK